MAARGSFVRWPHTFTVSKNTAEPQEEEEWEDIITGDCKIQVTGGDGMSNQKEAMLYDYVLYTKEEITEPILANYKVIGVMNGQTIYGVIMKFHTGLLTTRIWFNVTSE
jgi:accessory colonization factor AcfC